MAQVGAGERVNKLLVSRLERFAPRVSWSCVSRPREGARVSTDSTQHEGSGAELIGDRRHASSGPTEVVGVRVSHSLYPWTWEMSVTSRFRCRPSRTGAWKRAPQATPWNRSAELSSIWIGTTLAELVLSCQHGDRWRKLFGTFALPRQLLRVSPTDSVVSDPRGDCRATGSLALCRAIFVGVRTVPPPPPHVRMSLGLGGLVRFSAKERFSSAWRRSLTRKPLVRPTHCDVHSALVRRTPFDAEILQGPARFSRSASSKCAPRSQLLRSSKLPDQLLTN